MRHGKKYNHLSRTSAHRKALLRNLTIALITHKRINTTLAKAKALRKHAEPIITRAKIDTLHNRSVVFSSLQNKYAVAEIFGEVAQKVADRPGGYLRIIKTGSRQGDAAEMAMIEFVDFNETYNPNSESQASSGRTRRSRRSRRSSGGGATTTAAATAAVPATDATASEEE